MTDFLVSIGGRRLLEFLWYAIFQVQIGGWHLLEHGHLLEFLQ